MSPWLPEQTLLIERETLRWMEQFGSQRPVVKSVPVPANAHQRTGNLADDICRVLASHGTRKFGASVRILLAEDYARYLLFNAPEGVNDREGQVGYFSHLLQKELGSDPTAWAVDVAKTERGGRMIGVAVDRGVHREVERALRNVKVRCGGICPAFVTLFNNVAPAFDDLSGWLVVLGSERCTVACVAQGKILSLSSRSGSFLGANALVRLVDREKAICSLFDVPSRVWVFDPQDRVMSEAGRGEGHQVATYASLLSLASIRRRDPIAALRRMRAAA